MTPAPAPVRVFVSYAWEDDAFRELVKRLAVRLRGNGINARLDAWHALDGGVTIPEFMEREADLADRVLVLCSPKYRTKVQAMANGERITGVGWEHMLITSAIWNGADRAKYVPALLRGVWRESAPTFLSALPYIDLSDPITFEVNYLELLRRLTGRTESEPPLGSLPPDLDPVPVAPLSFGSRPSHATTPSPASPAPAPLNAGLRNHPFFDAIAYPWHREEAQDLHQALYLAVNTPARINLMYLRFGPNLPPLNLANPADTIWSDALQHLIRARMFEPFCWQLKADPSLRAIAPVVERVFQASG